MRLDAHVSLPPDYVARAVETLERTGAANVGGRQVPVGRSFFQRAVALAMTTPLGSGGARYRHRGAEGAADTVYLGVFRRDALDRVGGYDATMIRNEDYELNWRLRQNGHVVWFDPALHAVYRPRATCARSPGNIWTMAGGSTRCCGGTRDRYRRAISPRRFWWRVCRVGGACRGRRRGGARGGLARGLSLGSRPGVDGGGYPAPRTRGAASRAGPRGHAFELGSRVLPSPPS